MALYSARNYVVTARQWFPGDEIPGVSQDSLGLPYLVTDAGSLAVSPGDWIVIGSDNDLFLMSDAVFTATFKLIEDAPNDDRA